jgi:hypothetical protein
MTFIANQDTAKRVADIIRGLLSTSDGEIIAAVRALIRTLESAHSDIHALANHVEKPSGGLSDADKQKISATVEHARAEGYAEGVRAVQAKQHGAGAFRNVGGKLEFNEVALYVQREKHRLRPHTHEFVDKMALYAVEEFEPSKRQANFFSTFSSNSEARSHEPTSATKLAHRVRGRARLCALRHSDLPLQSDRQEAAQLSRL